MMCCFRFCVDVPYAGEDGGLPDVDRGDIARIFHSLLVTDITLEATQKDHLQLQSVPSDIKYPCTQCDYQTTRKQYLKRHMQSVHEGTKYSCVQCDYQATQKENLKRHIQSVHERTKYPCTQCDYQATQKGSLKIHI